MDGAGCTCTPVSGWAGRGRGPGTWAQGLHSASPNLSPGCWEQVETPPPSPPVTFVTCSDLFLFRAGSGRAVSSVIIDAQHSDDEDDQFVVEAAPQLPEVLELEGVSVPAWWLCSCS